MSPSETSFHEQKWPLVCVLAGQRPFLLVGAEGVGFEPTNKVTPANGFQEREPHVSDQHKHRLPAVRCHRFASHGRSDG